MPKARSFDSHHPKMFAFSVLIATFLRVGLSLAQGGSRANIVFIFTDDQDLHLGSLDYQSVVQRELVAKGTTFTQHYATVAKCCPSRASLFRGQAAHNTNLTDVHSPGGNYDKWLISGLNEDYLPFWLTAAGYNTEYLGKFINGYNTANYNITPGGWTHIDALVDDYTYEYNNVVMSANGQTPIHYPGWHQSDVLRAKAVDRIHYLASRNEPFYLTIAPAAPHVELGGGKFPVPPARYADAFPGARVPRRGSWNPEDGYQAQKVSWLRGLARMNGTRAARLDAHHRARLRALRGVDDLVADAVGALAAAGVLADTFVVYSSDNGFHLGAHRVAAGKSLPYREDTNVPLVVRGPGVPAGAASRGPGAHLDLAPTFLDIAGVSPDDPAYPPFLDGRSLLPQWQQQQQQQPNPDSAAAAEQQRQQCALGGGGLAGQGGEVLLNVEFWGEGEVEDPWGLIKHPNTTYKTLRVVADADADGDGRSLLYSRWCTGEAELYDTAADPDELVNLARDPADAEAQRLMARLNALLLASKSCAGATCRNPWRVLQPEPARRGVVVDDEDEELTIASLAQALQPEYDAFFDSIPQVAFRECMVYQFRPNEEPFWPGDVELGEEHRKPTDNYVDSSRQAQKVGSNDGRFGTLQQRYADLGMIMQTAVELTPEQIG
ncbi:arylsulfatase [Xylariomycetidae sp. FL0641]|nr:arylsulfatase [Xylariomycetidae sp. FL0641]